MPSVYSTCPPLMSDSKTKIAELIADTMLDQLERNATIAVDCKVHGRFKHSPIADIEPGACPDCHFENEMLKEHARSADWIDPSKLH